ncbi:hypothetical protein K435DRAFT_671964, partial [Dendrothele bispora CBS 962.96]
GDPAFADHLVYKPSRMFTNSSKNKESRIYSEMWTGKWWWAVQVSFCEWSTIFIGLQIDY